MNFEHFIIAVLFIHQTLDVIGVKGYVDKPKLISPDTIGWCIFVVLVVLYYLNVAFINYIFIVIFGLVLYGLYFFHWKFYFFGATKDKIHGYNKYFSGTHRVLKESSTRLVPDTFHIVHTILYLITFVTLIIDVILS